MLLEFLFENGSELQRVAGELLVEIRDRAQRGVPFKVDEWTDWIKNHDCSQNAYFTVRKRLLEIGVVIKANKEGKIERKARENKIAIIGDDYYFISSSIGRNFSEEVDAFQNHAAALKPEPPKKVTE
jgi:hypothetical protein